MFKFHAYLFLPVTLKQKNNAVVSKRKEKEKEYSTYPGFPYHSGQLVAYLAHKHYFIIALKEKDPVIRHQPDNVQKFRDWLIANKIRDVNDRRPI